MMKYKYGHFYFRLVPNIAEELSDLDQEVIKDVMQKKSESCEVKYYKKTIVRKVKGRQRNIKRLKKPNKKYEKK